MARALKLLAGLLALTVAALVALMELAPAQFARIEISGERAAAGLHLRGLDVAGFHIVYLDGGTGPPLLLLHGFGADKDNWTRVARLLTPHYRVIAPDLPGFGDSAKPAGADYSIAAQAGTIAAFAEALHLQQFDLGGNSMGGWLACAYAAAHPRQVHSLWLLAPAGVATAQPSELIKLLAGGGDNPLVARTPEQFEALIRFVFVKPPYIPAALVRVLAQRHAQNAALEQKIFAQVVASPPLETLVRGLTTPTLIVWGDHDRALHDSGAAVLHQLMPDSTVRIMPRVGHVPMIEAVRQSASDYLEFRGSLH